MGAEPMTSQRSRARGFSLVETMIAMVIIVIALFAILSMTIHTSATQTSLKELEVAKEAACRKIEEIRGLPWGSFVNLTIPSVVNTYVGPYVTAGNPPFPFTPVVVTVNPFTVDGLSYNLSIARDPWNTTLNNPQQKGKGKVILHGVNPTPGPGVDPIYLVDIEVLIEWNGVRGPSRYSARMMLAKDQKN
jgi:prepilin-type N-terminal cleavage/methylation domain-containing protein